MFTDNTAVPCTKCSRCGNILLLLDGKNLAPDKTGHAYPVKKAEGYKYADHTGTKYADALEKRAGIIQFLQGFLQADAENDDDKNIRYGINNLYYTHHNHINFAAEITGYGAVYGT